MNADIYSLFLTGANVESMSVAALKQLITSTGYTLDGAPAWLECPVLQQLILPAAARRPPACAGRPCGPMRRPLAARMPFGSPAL